MFPSSIPFHSPFHPSSQLMRKHSEPSGTNPQIIIVVWIFNTPRLKPTQSPIYICGLRLTFKFKEMKTYRSDDGNVSDTDRLSKLQRLSCFPFSINCVSGPPRALLRQIHITLLPVIAPNWIYPSIWPIWALDSCELTEGRSKTKSSVYLLIVEWQRFLCCHSMCFQIFWCSGSFLWQPITSCRTGSHCQSLRGKEESRERALHNLCTANASKRAFYHNTWSSARSGKAQ